MKQQVKLYAVHGFLGLASDWDFLQPPPLAIDLFDACRSLGGLWEWAHRFNHEISHPNTTLNIIVGYSLGGRLALHVLLDDPSLWDGAVIISAHPGLETNEEKLQRRKNDAEWAHRFSLDPWNLLMERWNSQSSLKNSLSLERNEKDFSRQQLASALISWSLGRQDNLRKPLQKLNIPILWVAGERDEKFSAVAESLSFHHPLSAIKIISNAGHRVPWEKPQEFQELLNRFIQNIRENADAYAQHSLA